MGGRLLKRYLGRKNAPMLSETITEEKKVNRRKSDIRNSEHPGSDR